LRYSYGDTGTEIQYSYGDTGTEIQYSCGDTGTEILDSMSRKSQAVQTVYRVELRYRTVLWRYRYHVEAVLRRWAGRRRRRRRKVEGRQQLGVGGWP